MKKVIILFYLISLLNVQCLNENNKEFLECINPKKIAYSSSECTSIKIPDSEGYKCCSMEIELDGNTTYNCFALENEYTKNKTILNEYIANRSIFSLFGANGGQIKVECGNEINSTINYEKISDEYSNCYQSHINGVDNENDCHKYNIPEKEKSQCCFMETQQRDDTGNTIKDKRCYIIQDDYLNDKNNLNQYLLDKTNKKSLNEIKNVNITINCKNHDIFEFKGKLEDQKKNQNINNTDVLSSDIENTDNQKEPVIFNSTNKKKDSGLSAGAIVGIIIACIAVLGGGAILIIYCVRKRKVKMEEKDSANDMNNIYNNSYNKASDTNNIET